MAEGGLHGLPMPRAELQIGRAYAARSDDIAERTDPAGLACEQAVACRSILTSQAFDDALDAKRTGSGTDKSVDDARKSVEDAKKKVADEKANVASVGAKSGMPQPTRLEAALAVARSELAAAELGVEHTRVRAPFDGTVLNLIGKEGELAAPSPENTLVVFGDLSASERDRLRSLLDRVGAVEEETE